MLPMLSISTLVLHTTRLALWHTVHVTLF